MSGVELTSTTDLSKFTVVQLRELLKSRALQSSGTKVELIERLKENLAAEEKILEADDSSSTKDDSIERAPITTDAIVTEDDVLGPDPSSQKKADGDIENETVTKINDNVVEKDEVSANQGDQIKKADDAAMETLDAKAKRALRFGLPLSNDDLKRKRAERENDSRFGLKVDSASEEEKKRRRLERFGSLNGTAKDDGDTAVNKNDILKKRAERFGLPVKESAKNSSSGSDAAVRLSADDVEKASLEALERRAKRFGVCSEQAEIEMRKLKRAERFGLDKI